MNQYRQTVLAMSLLVFAAGCIVHFAAVVMCTLADQEGYQVARKVLLFPVGYFVKEIEGIPGPAISLASCLWSISFLLLVVALVYLGAVLAKRKRKQTDLQHIHSQ